MTERYQVVVSTYSTSGRIASYKVVDWTPEQMDINYDRRDRTPPFAEFHVPNYAPKGGYEDRLALKYAEAVCDSLNREYQRVHTAEVSL